jgi:hypothetical protein
MSWHVGWGGSVCTRLPCGFQSVCERHTYNFPPHLASEARGRHSSCSHVPQSIASCRLPGVLSRWTGSPAAGLEDCHQRLEEHCRTLCKAAIRIQRPRPVQCLGESIQWVETARYLGVTLDAQLTCSAHVYHVGKKAAQRLGVLGPLLNRRSGLSVRNLMLLYKQLICPVMDFACLIWSFPQPRLEAASVTIQVSSHCDWRTLVRWQQANSRGFGNSILRRPHQSSD